MRQDVRFRSQGLNCSGWLYIPDGLAPDQKAPAIVMAHGGSGVKEMALPFFAERFMAAGLVTLVFDYRFFGASEGEPRQQMFQLEQVEDYRNAITWLSDQPSVDAERIGVWGTSLSGGVVLRLGQVDPRVKAIVGQVPSAVNGEVRRKINRAGFDRLREIALRDRIARYKSGVVSYLKVVAPPGEFCLLPTPDSYEWFTRWGALAPNWRNEVTLESLEKMQEFDPLSLIHLISPIPLLMVIAEGETLLPRDLLVAAYERAGEPKSLVVLPCGHFDVYGGPWGEQAATAAVEWFRKHLGRV